VLGGEGSTHVGLGIETVQVQIQPWKFWINSLRFADDQAMIARSLGRSTNNDE